MNPASRLAPCGEHATLWTSAGRERPAARIANRAAHKIRISGQSQNGQGTWRHIPNGILLAADEVIE